VPRCVQLDALCVMVTGRKHLHIVLSCNAVLQAVRRDYVWLCCCRCVLSTPDDAGHAPCCSSSCSPGGILSSTYVSDLNGSPVMPMKRTRPCCFRACSAGRVSLITCHVVQAGRRGPGGSQA
jgi:hypothetical protein